MVNFVTSATHTFPKLFLYTDAKVFQKLCMVWVVILAHPHPLLLAPSPMWRTRAMLNSAKLKSLGISLMDLIYISTPRGVWEELDSVQCKPVKVPRAPDFLNFLSFHARMARTLSRYFQSSYREAPGIMASVANQRFSAVTAQRAILPADAPEGGLSKFNCDY